MVKLYAQAVGVSVVLIGVLGLLLGEKSLLGVLNIDIFEDFVHLVTGGALAYVGFAKVPERTAVAVVGAIGVAYLVIGVVGFFAEDLFGLVPSGYTVVDNVIHLVLGALGVMAVSAARRPATTA